jgi:hypothetical protein
MFLNRRHDSLRANRLSVTASEAGAIYLRLMPAIGDTAFQQLASLLRRHLALA